MAAKILIVDDHPLIAEGIKTLIEPSPEFEVVNIVHSLNDLWNELTKDIDLLILDLNVKGQSSSDIIEEIKSQNPMLKILIYSSYNKPSLVRKVLKKGVNGYILKDASKDELLEALTALLNNEQYIGSRVARSKRIIVKDAGEFDDSFSKEIVLSNREREVALLIAEGLDSQAVADRLFISKNTVQTHRKKIFKKMNVRSVVELVKVLHNL
jgi:DNA-binding NarL/FixJ family response regulator